MDNKISLLRAYFAQNDMLLCNINKDLPSLETVGGDWNSIVELIERGEVFYSKFYKNRATYLSRDYYFRVKSSKQRFEGLSPRSAAIYNFLGEVTTATSREIKDIFGLSAKDYTKCMDELFKELLVTALCREKTLNENWSSFRWGTFGTWEERPSCPKPFSPSF